MRRIQILQFYRGAPSGEMPIYPDIYEEGDPRLFGLENYLVDEQRKAIWLDAAPEPVVIDEPLEDDIADDFEDDGEEPEADEPFYSALDELQDQFGAADASGLSAELLRGEIETRGLEHRVVPTGKNGNALKADLVKVLAETPAE